MKNHVAAGILTLSALAVGVLAGCGGGTHQDEAITISITPAVTSLAPNAQKSFTLAVSGSSFAAVHWGLTGASCSGTACGMLTNASGNSITYTAPAVPPSPDAHVTITATAEVSRGFVVNNPATETFVIVSGPNDFTISLSPSTLSLTANNSNQFSVISQPNTFINQLNISWALTGVNCSGDTCGTLSNTTGSAVTYTAPPVPPSPDAHVTITASAVDSTGVHMVSPASASILVTPSFTLSMSPSVSSVATGNTQQFLLNANPPAVFSQLTINWSLAGPNCSGNTCGTLNTTSGGAVIYTAPAAAPSPDAHVTITAVATAAGSSDPVSAFETFVVTSQNNALLNGDYAFQFFGIDQGAVSNSATPGTALGSFGMAGRFHADGNGNLTNVEMDINLTNLVQHFVASTGNYSIAPNERRGIMTLNEGTTGSAILLRFVLGIDGDGRFIEFDDSNGLGHLGSGVFRLQDPGAFSVNAFKGDFVFGFAGETPVDRRVAVAGHITSDSTGAISGGYADDNLITDDTSAINPTSFSAIDSSTGRGTTTWTFQSFIVDTSMTSSFAFYIVDATDAYFITTDPRAEGGPNSVGQAFLVGEARLQQSSVTSASLNGNTIYYSSDISFINSPTRTVTPAATVGQVVFQPTSPTQGSVTGGRLDINLGDGLPRNCNISSGNYMLGASGSAQNGRADVRLSCSDGTARRFIAYLAGPGRGFAIGVHLHSPADQEYGELGFLEPQDLSSPFIDGNYVGASFLPSTSAAPNVSFTYNSTTGSITGTADVSDLHGLSPDVDYTGTTADGGTAGRFDITFNSPSSTVQGGFTGWLVDSSKFVLLGVPFGGNNQAPVLFIAQQ